MIILVHTATSLHSFTEMYVHVRAQNLGVPKLYMYGEIVDWILDDNALVQQ